MGAAFTKDSTIPVCSSSNSFDDVPENCISIVLMFLEPTEICKLAALNRAFRSASSADFIWNSKLPSNYAVLLRRILPPCSSDRDHRRLPKKEIFARLSRPNLFDCGTKELWLDKSSGKLFVSISSKALKITGIEDRRYWNFVPTDESSGISETNLVGRDTRRIGVGVPKGKLQPILQASAGKAFKEVWKKSDRSGAGPWVGDQASEVRDDSLQCPESFI